VILSALLVGVTLAQSIKKIRPSDPIVTNKTLAIDKDQGYKLTYSFWTTIEEYDDDTYQGFLNSIITLHDLETDNFRTNEDVRVRMTVGWRDP